MMKKPFKIVEHGPRRFLLLESPWTPAVAEFMKNNGLKDLRLSAYAGWRESSIEFLKDIPFLERLDLMPIGLQDVTPLYSLPKLRKLSVTAVKKEIDFTKISQLEELRIGWNSRYFSSLLDCNRLKVLGIDRHPVNDFNDFAKLIELKTLAIAYSPIKSLKGIERLNSLQQISLAITNQLEELTGIDGCRKMTRVSIEKAKNLKRINSVSRLYKLKELTMTACPEIESLESIKGLPKLEYVCLLGTTRVKDGDLSVLKTLPSLIHASFVNRGNYSHKTEEFPKSYITP